MRTIISAAVVAFAVGACAASTPSRSDPGAPPARTPVPEENPGKPLPPTPTEDPSVFKPPPTGDQEFVEPPPASGSRTPVIKPPINPEPNPTPGRVKPREIGGIKPDDN
ncbi:MAG: hypothetical protein AB7E79_04180 [Rhodospirillaceae bacterium]